MILLLLFMAALGSTSSFAQKKPSAPLFSASFVEASYLNLKPFVENYKPTLLSKKPLANGYDPLQIDYLLTYKLGKDQFRFYQTPSKTFPLSYSCTSPRLLLAKGVHVGMSQAAFEGLFNRKVTGTTVQLGGYGEFELYTFTFVKQILTRITYEAQLD